MVKSDGRLPIQMPKVPLWARWLGSWRAWRRSIRARRDAERAKDIMHHIATITVRTNWSDRDGGYDTFFSLFENGRGHREFKFRSLDPFGQAKAEEFRLYVESIEPWLYGDRTTEYMIVLAKAFDRHHMDKKHD